MDTSESYKFCREMKYAGMEYPILVSKMLSQEKHDAIAACFASFRIITDEIIDLLRQQKISEIRYDYVKACLDDWSKMILDSRDGKSGDHKIQPALVDVFSKYKFSLNPWKEFRKFLEFHLEHNHISDLNMFKKYSQWAYSPPVETFLNILFTDNKNNDNKSEINPGFLAPELGTLFFIVHTLTDIPGDLKNTADGFLFLPLDLLEKNDLDRASLQKFSSDQSINSAFRNVVDEMYHIGRDYEMYCREKLVIIRGHIGREEWFTLDLLVNIYANFLYRIWECPEAIFRDGFPLDPAMVYINALKLQKDMGLSFEQNLSKLLVESVA
jgi:phytoene/squalene synthetase